MYKKIKAIPYGYNPGVETKETYFRQQNHINNCLKP